MRSKLRMRRRYWQIGLVACAAAGALAATGATASAYQGYMYGNCGGSYGAQLYQSGGPTFCYSETESNVRRAIAHGYSDYASVRLWTLNNTFRQGNCFTGGCTADTGYFGSDITGYGQIYNLGGPYNVDTFVGYMYP